MDVITIGHTSIDHVRINGRENLQLGGAAVYSAMGAKIFSRAGIVSRVGSDFPVEFYSLLKSAEIDTLGLHKVRGKSTSFTIEYDREGMANYRDYSLNVGVHIRPEDIPSRYLDARAFHLAPMAASKQNIFLNFLRNKSNALVSLNSHIGYFMKYKNELLRLIPRVDIFTINDEEAMRLTNSKSLEHALNAFKRREHNLG